MSMISPRVEREISKNLDFRLLVYIYMYQHPEATKAGLAERLGITPITMSRAIAAGKKGIDEALVPVVLELLKEIDFGQLFAAQSQIRFIWMEQGRYEREGKLREILCKKFGCSASQWQYSRVPTNLDYVLVLDDGTRKYFNEVQGSYGNVRQTMSRAMSSISRIPGNDEVTIVCYSQETLETLMNQYTAQMIRRYSSAHPITVMWIDLEREEIEAEYILYEPGKEMYFFYEMEETGDSQDIK